MARTALTIQSLGTHGSSIADQSVSRTACNNADNFSAAHPGGEILVMLDNGSAGSIVLTVPAVATNATFQMAEDLTVTVATGKIGFLCIPDRGFNQGSGVVNINSDTQDAAAYLSVFHPARTP